MSLENAGSPWTLDEEERLYEETGNGMSVAEIARMHGRTNGAITSRQRQMGLQDETGKLVLPLPEFKSHLRAQRKHEARPSSPMSTATQAGKGATSPPGRSSDAVIFKPDAAAQSLAWPQDFSWTGDWIEMLWEALRHDIAALPSGNGQPEAIVKRGIDVALARLSPGDDFHPRANLAELGEKYGISRERIRQIETKALRRLRARVRQKTSFTARILEKMADAVPDDHAEAPLSWFAAELARQGCGATFTEFALMAFLGRSGTTAKNARRLIRAAMPSVRSISRTEVSARQNSEQSTLPERVQKANGFVLGILKKAAWPERLDGQPIDLSSFRPLRGCRYEQPYYSQTLQRLVQFDSMGERRLIRALDICTIVTEFTEQPLEIAYDHDGAVYTYIPDLLIRTDTDLFFVIEIKGRNRLADRRTLSKAEAAQRYLGERGIGYCLVDENGIGLEDLRAMAPDSEFEHRLRELLRYNTVVTRKIFEQSYDRQMLGWAYDQLQGAVLRNGMRYETQLIERADSRTRYIFDFKLRSE